METPAGTFISSTLYKSCLSSPSKDPSCKGHGTAPSTYQRAFLMMLLCIANALVMTSGHLDIRSVLHSRRHQRRQRQLIFLFEWSHHDVSLLFSTPTLCVQDIHGGRFGVSIESKKGTPMLNKQQTPQHEQTKPASCVQQRKPARTSTRLWWYLLTILQWLMLACMLDVCLSYEASPYLPRYAVPPTHH